MKKIMRRFWNQVIIDDSSKMLLKPYNDNKGKVITHFLLGENHVTECGRYGIDKWSHNWKEVNCYSCHVQHEAKIVIPVMLGFIPILLILVAVFN